MNTLIDKLKYAQNTAKLSGFAETAEAFRELIKLEEKILELQDFGDGQRIDEPLTER